MSLLLGSALDSLTSAGTDVSAGSSVAVSALPSAGAVVSAFGLTDVAFQVVLSAEEGRLRELHSNQIEKAIAKEVPIFSRTHPCYAGKNQTLIRVSAPYRREFLN